ncbi:MAG: MYXO-CTERM sorting domain-containing protein [Sandaracinaceae bacterium]
MEVARAEGDTLDACVPIEVGDGQPLLVVARAAADSTGERPHQPKGWTLLELDADGGSASCDVLPDAGPGADAGVDGGAGTDASTSVDAGAGTDAAIAADGGPGMDDAGCSCRAGQPGSSSGGLWLSLAAVLVLVRRRR